MVYPRYYSFLAGLALYRGTCSTMLVPQPLHDTVHNINGMTESNLGWPTSLIMSVRSDRPIRLCWPRTTIESKAHIIHTFDYKANMYSKLIAIIQHVPVYFVIRCKLSCLYFTCMFFLHVSLY